MESKGVNFSNGTAEQVRGVDRRIAELRGSVKALPMQDVEYQRLTRAQKGVEDIMTQVQGRLKEAEINAAVQDSTAEVLDRAVLPTGHLGTTRPVIFAVALFSGVIVCVAASLLRDRVATTVNNRTAATTITDDTSLRLSPCLPLVALFP